MGNQFHWHETRDANMSARTGEQSSLSDRLLYDLAPRDLNPRGLQHEEGPDQGPGWAQKGLALLPE